MNLIFLRPVYLGLLFLLPLILLVHFMSLSVKRKYALRFSNFEAIARIRNIDLYSSNLSVLVLVSIIIVLISFSLAGPVLIVERSSSSFSFVLSIDVSQSMEANDVSPTRFDAALEDSKRFVDSSPLGTRIGVVSFSGSSFVESRVTDDKSTLDNALSNIQLSTIGGTDIDDAIVNSVNLLNGEDRKAIVLLSDGRFNAGNIQKSIAYAQQNGVVVNTIGIGTDEGGVTSFGISKFEQNSLEAVSFNTGGQFYKVTNREALDSAFDQIRQLKVGRVSIDLSTYLILIELICVVILFIMLNLRYKGFV